MRPLYQVLSVLVSARASCLAKPQTHSEAAGNATRRILAMVKEHMPSGAGLDSGTSIDLDKSTAEKLVFVTAFHHMDDNGFYAGWTDHTVTVRASLLFTLDLKISGPDRNGIKDYLHDVFDAALMTQVAE